ncbi:MAG: signal peptide peptidase SppA [Candidatus Latescibacteria bacterium]|nr:signal peptide peptidase SppA [Candidatus Latescibacterota bacterium]
MIPLFLISLLVSSTPLSVATTDDALALMANPAGLATNRNINLYYLYNFGSTDTLTKRGDFWHNQSFALQAGNLGISYLDMTDFRIGVGTKLTDGISFGTAYRRVHGRSFWDAGILIRPHQYISFGAVMQSIGHQVRNQYITGIGIRPLTNRLTLTCDFYSDDWKNPRIGLETEPINGVEIKGKITPDGVYSIQAGINLDKISIGSILNSATEKNSSKRWAGYLRLSGERRRSLIKPAPRFLEMNLTGTIADQKTGFSLFGGSVDYTTYQVLNTIQKAKQDKSIKGIVLKLNNPNMSFAVAQEIKSALHDFKKENKELIVYAPNMGIIDYYLACSGDQIISHPLGETHIPGITSRSMFLKGSLDKLGLEFDYERIGKHKNAPEMLTQDTMSLATREVINSILDDYYEHITNTIAEERNFTKEQIIEKINYGFYLAKQARQHGLLDDLYYEDELDSIFKAKYKGFAKITDTRFNRQKDYEYDWSDLPVVAVIYANGEITQGESRTDFLMGGNTCGANTMVRAIRQARKDKNTKAVILRIDSPGGDGFASDLIFRELELTRKDKPVIVSMGSLSASGGYYIAMVADKIFVSPATITGSIGVFAAKLVTRDMYEKLGIKTETLKRGERADAYSSDRTFTDSEREILQNQLQEFYDQFIDKVAQYRNLTVEYVDSVGQGRIWTGNQAQQNLLVDSIGGLLNAIDYAKEKAQVKKVKLEFGPVSRMGFKKILASIMKIYE